MTQVAKDQGTLGYTTLAMLEVRTMMPLGKLPRGAYQSMFFTQ